MQTMRASVRTGSADDRAGAVAAVPRVPGPAADRRGAGGRSIVSSSCAAGGGVMGRRFLRCTNRACPVPHGAVLGRLTEGSGLELSETVTDLRCYFDSARAQLTCP